MATIIRVMTEAEQNNECLDNKKKQIDVSICFRIHWGALQPEDLFNLVGEVVEKCHHDDQGIIAQLARRIMCYDKEHEWTNYYFLTRGESPNEESEIVIHPMTGDLLHYVWGRLQE